MDRLAATLLRVSTDLAALRCRWALVGGLAVAVRAEPRTTRDVDVVLAVAGDREAENVVRALFGRGYRQLDQGVFEQVNHQRLATVRLVAPGLESEGVVVDLLFASSGIEPEIVAASDLRTMPDGSRVPVASRGHLMAMKVLAHSTNPNRPLDLPDLYALARKASPGDLEEARRALALIAERGYDGGMDLRAKLEQIVLQAERTR